MENAEAFRQWDGVAPGWIKWEHVSNRMLAAATEVLLDRAGVAAGGRVLDIATGAGDQARAAARRVGPAGFVLATDISPTMLEFVAEQARVADLANIAIHACAAENLPRDHAPFDSAICRCGMMLLPDPVAAVAAVRDVLRPGGRLGGLVMSSPAANPFYVAVPSILRRHANKPAPTSGPGFLALADPELLTDLFAGAGLTDVTITTLEASLNRRRPRHDSGSLWCGPRYHRRSAPIRSGRRLGRSSYDPRPVGDARWFRRADTVPYRQRPEATLIPDMVTWARSRIANQRAVDIRARARP
jgi:SAM-dependent methyltransferase